MSHDPANGTVYLVSSSTADLESLWTSAILGAENKGGLEIEEQVLWAVSLLESSCEVQWRIVFSGPCVVDEARFFFKVYLITLIPTSLTLCDSKMAAINENQLSNAHPTYFDQTPQSFTVFALVVIFILHFFPDISSLVAFFPLCRSNSWWCRDGER